MTPLAPSKAPLVFCVWSTFLFKLARKLFWVHKNPSLFWPNEPLCDILRNLGSQQNNDKKGMKFLQHDCFYEKIKLLKTYFGFVWDSGGEKRQELCHTKNQSKIKVIFVWSNKFYGVSKEISLIKQIWSIWEYLSRQYDTKRSGTLSIPMCEWQNNFLGMWIDCPHP